MEVLRDPKGRKIKTKVKLQRSDQFGNPDIPKYRVCIPRGIVETLGWEKGKVLEVEIYGQGVHIFDPDGKTAIEILKNWKKEE